MITINNLEEMEPYYCKEINTYIFNDDVFYYFDLCVGSNINANNITAHNINANNINAKNIIARDITACDINACDIYAKDIKAVNINANNISFNAICCAYESLKCKSIKGRRERNKIICLDDDIEIKEE